MAAGAFYAVRVGRCGGIYSTWAECEAQVKNFPGAKYKKFKTRSEAEAFIGQDQNGSSSSNPVLDDARVRAAASVPVPAKICYYAVRIGHTPGIYQRWKPECFAQVDGFKGAEYKKFATLAEAEAYISDDVPDAVNACTVSSLAQPADCVATSARDAVSTLPEASLASLVPPASPSSSSTAACVGSAPTKAHASSTPPSVNVTTKLRIYTDGSCPNNVGSAGQQGRAGWGIVVVSGEGGGTEVDDFYGPVAFSAGDPLYLGATCGTNNTGELTAVAMACKWLAEVEGPRPQPCTILYDSKYAANVAQGKWKANTNTVLAHNAHAALKSARLGGRKILFEHVKGHSGDVYNDRADRNADSGAAGHLKCWDRGPTLMFVSSAAVAREAKQTLFQHTKRPAPESGAAAGASESSPSKRARLVSGVSRGAAS